MASSRRRLASPFATILALSLAGGACWFGAESAARYLEDRSRQDVEQALSDQDWVRVTTDGLQVRLTGTAPSELDRFRAMTLAGGAVDPAAGQDRDEHTDERREDVAPKGGHASANTEVAPPGGHALRDPGAPAGLPGRHGVRPRLIAAWRVSVPGRYGWHASVFCR